MTDPLEPFRAEYKALQTAFQAVSKGNFIQGFNGCVYPMPSKGRIEGVLELKQRMDRAFKAWKIAEREGPDAALLWKLSN